jgi:hypothetical protein
VIRRRSSALDMRFCPECQKETPHRKRTCLLCRHADPKVSKMGNCPSNCLAGFWHQSTLEAEWCNALHAAWHAGSISDLEAHPQPSFNLEVNGIHITSYRADFRWKEGAAVAEADMGGPVVVVADAKGRRTETYVIKERLMRALLGIEIVELRGKPRLG